MRSNSTLGLFALLAWLLHGAVPELAQCQSAPAGVEDLARRADVVVVGKVTGVRSEWSADRSRICTRITLSVDSHIKGDESQSFVTITTLGGEVDGIGELYSHMPRFKQDENVIVFAARDRQGQLSVIDGEEGKFTVTKEGGTGQQFVRGNEPLTVFTSRLKAVVNAQRGKE